MKSLQSRPKTPSLNLLSVVLVTAGSLVLVLWVAAKSLQLRPGGDDYCWAVGAGYGALSGPSFWWETFSGYAVHNISLTYLVGMPLLHLPLALSSAAPFLLAAIVVAFLVLVPLMWMTRKRTGRWALALAVGPVVMVTWWVYWWYPVTLEQDGPNLWLAVSMVHNQNINGGYVIETSIGTMLWFSAWRFTKIWGLRASWIFIVAGAWAALSGPALAVASIAMLTVGLGWWRWLGVDRNRAVASGLALGVMSTIVFSVLGYLAPGSRARSARMGTSVEMNPTRFGEWVNHVFPGTVDLWWQAFTTPGILITVGMSLVIGFFAHRVGWKLDLVRSGKLILAGATFSLLLAVASGITNFFIYAAPYHAVPSRIVAFSTTWWVGVTVGSLVASRTSATAPIGGVILVGLATSTASLGVVLNMTISMAERAEMWNRGPAPVTGIVTDYLSWPNGRTCWQDLIQITPKLPSRGQPPPPYEFRLEDRSPILT